MYRRDFLKLSGSATVALLFQVNPLGRIASQFKRWSLTVGATAGITMEISLCPLMRERVGSCTPTSVPGFPSLISPGICEDKSCVGYLLRQLGIMR